MKRVSNSLRKTSLIIMIGLQTFGMTACGTESAEKAKETVEQKAEVESKAEDTEDENVPTESDNGSTQDSIDLTNADISEEISFDLPKDLTMEAYSSEIGFHGGCIFKPDVYESGSEILPAEWTAAGMVSRYDQEDVLIWDGNSISDVIYDTSRSIMEFLENINDLSEPALLMHANHQLYTSYGIEVMQKHGVDPSTVDLSSDYWYLFIAKPGEKYGYVVTLNQKNYTKDDMMELGKSIKFLK